MEKALGGGNVGFYVPGWCNSRPGGASVPNPLWVRVLEKYKTDPDFESFASLVDKEPCWGLDKFAFDNVSGTFCCPTEKYCCPHSAQVCDKDRNAKRKSEIKKERKNSRDRKSNRKDSEIKEERKNSRDRKANRKDSEIKDIKDLKKDVVELTKATERIQEDLARIKGWVGSWKA
eukprot:CAMPEP_0182863674 /NCGR_PEP_ID=MMETSP0034_2-20130328/6778_1 /TAXON_ID=156128 /ORGANISM="Nephroselmis pyriformis, Strain CCMP717" /LENGTH=174 /DNA_ID=CAMNT_0024995913 /DNA_START=751 /DNA_END=1275 /DNA_ORIENTATION=-